MTLAFYFQFSRELFYSVLHGYYVLLRQFFSCVSEDESLNSDIEENVFNCDEGDQSCKSDREGTDDGDFEIAMDEETSLSAQDIYKLLLQT